jgi:hypothetical protein
MTEAEWLEGADPKPMLAFLRGKTSDRKLRLFTVACCRHIWHLMPDEQSRDLVHVAEQFADGAADEARRASVYAAASSTFPRLKAPLASGAASMAATVGKNGEVVDNMPRHVADLAANAVRGEQSYDEALEVITEERKHQCSLLRDIIGNPFRPVAVDPAWRTPRTIAVAQAIYDERCFDDLPILADALEEAGCTSADLLAHLRGPGPHVRGCWAVDLVLGKA